MSQTEIPTIGADEAGDRPGGDSGGGRQPEPTGFWGSMPRVLTALGGLVTALGTAAAVYFGGIADDDPTPVPTPAPPTHVVFLPQPPAPAPVVDAAATSRSSRTSGVLSGRETASTPVDAEHVIAEWESSLDADTAAVAEGCAFGSSGDCGILLGILLDDCERGEPFGCDVLFLVSPSGSALEEYGDSCGGRIPDNEKWCSELVGG